MHHPFHPSKFSFLRQALLPLALVLGIGLSSSPVYALRTAMPTNTNVLPLILKAADYPPLLNHKPQEISMLSCKEDRPAPILFQVDELNEEGRVVSFYGDGGRVAPDSTPGIIDGNDELIVMLRDMGEPCPAPQVAKLRGAVYVLTVSAPYLEGPAIAYLVISEQGYVPNGSYVNYEASTHTVRSEGYLWGYDPARPFFYDRVGYAELSGRPFADVFDRIKTRVTANGLGNLLKINIDEDDFKSKLDGVRAGPVRMTRELSVKVDVLPGLTVDALVTYHHYSRSRTAIARIKLPAPAALFTSSLDIAFVHDFTSMKGTRLCTAEIPQGALVDGKMTQPESRIEYGSKVWSLMTGLGINEMLILNYDKALNLTPVLYFVDSDTLPGAPEEIPGGLPSVGFQFSWQNLKAQWYQFGVDIFALSAFPEAGGNGFYDTVKAKPVIRLEPLAQAG